MVDGVPGGAEGGDGGLALTRGTAGDQQCRAGLRVAFFFHGLRRARFYTRSRRKEKMRGTLFESMVSVRKARGGEPHLGLGLYIARFIAEFHGGAIRADNLPSGDGVTMSATFERPPK